MVYIACTVDSEVRNLEITLIGVVFHGHVRLDRVHVLAHFFIPNVTSGQQPLVLQLARPQLSEDSRALLAIAVSNVPAVVQALELVECQRGRVNDAARSDDKALLGLDFLEVDCRVCSVELDCLTPRLHGLRPNELILVQARSALPGGCPFRGLVILDSGLLHHPNCMLYILIRLVIETSRCEHALSFALLWRGTLLLFH
jgi:hypothetical protein